MWTGTSWPTPRRWWRTRRTRVPFPCKSAAPRSTADCGSPAVEAVRRGFNDLPWPRSPRSRRLRTCRRRTSRRRNRCSGRCCSPGAIGAVTEILSGDDFYRENHGVIFRLPCALPAGRAGRRDHARRRARGVGELEQVGGQPASTSWPRSSRPLRTRPTTHGSCARWRRCAASSGGRGDRAAGAGAPGGDHRPRRPGRTDRLRTRPAARHR